MPPSLLRFVKLSKICMCSGTKVGKYIVFAIAILYIELFAT